MEKKILKSERKYVLHIPRKQYYPVLQLKSDNWGTSNHKRVLFKKYPVKKNAYAIMMYNELLIPELCKQIGLQSAINRPSRSKLAKGISSEDFVRDDETILFSDDNSLKGCIQNILNWKKQGICKVSRQDIMKIKEQLFKMALLDFCTFQRDRHHQNFMFLIDSGKHLRFAPIFDNEYCFFADGLNGTNIAFKKDKEWDFKELARQYDYDLCNGGWVFSINSEARYFKNIWQNCWGFCKFALSNQANEKVFWEVLDNLNVKSAAKQLKENFSVDMDERYITFADWLVENSKQALKKQYFELKNQKTKASKNLKNEKSK